MCPMSEAVFVVIKSASQVQTSWASAGSLNICSNFYADFGGIIILIANLCVFT